MKSEKGITLVILVVYIITSTILISIMAYMSSKFFYNMTFIKDQDEYAVEFNKFNMFFVSDIKKNLSAEVETHKITFEDGNVYEYKEEDKAIFRNGKQIAKNVNVALFSMTEQFPKPQDNHNTTKKIINVKLAIGKKKRNYVKMINYVLKYW